MTLKRIDSDGNGKAEDYPVAQSKIKLRRKRGRPRTAATDPVAELTRGMRSAPDARRTGGEQTAIVRRSRSGSTSHPPAEGVDRYLDHEYLAEERKRRYRIEDFHIAIKNENDHEGDPIKIRQHPVMKAAIDEMVGSHEFPFNSAQDVYRVGAFELMRKLYYLRQSGWKLTNWMAQLRAQSDMLEMQEEAMAYQKTLERLRKNVHELQAKHGAFGKRQAAVMVVQVRNGAKGMTDRAWGKWYLDQIDQEFGELVRSQEQRVRIRRGE